MTSDSVLQPRAPRPTPVVSGLDSVRSPLFETKVPLAAPTLPPTENLLDQIRALLEQSQLTNASAVAEFEQRAAAYLGAPDAVAVSSCTSGLMLVERLLGLSGEVILPSFTFFATGHGLLWNGLEPVFVDCDPETFNIDPERIEAAITPRTSAILAVHIFGCPTPVRHLKDIAARHGLRLIFDGAHAFGSQIDGTHVVEWGDATVFSLTPTKPLVAGEGGLIVTHDPDLAQRLRQARNYGKGQTYDCEILGLNARMTEIQAVLGTAGLAYVEWGIKRRNEVAEVYQRKFHDVDGLTPQRIGPAVRSSRKDFAVLIYEQRFGVSRAQLEDALARDRVETRRYFDPPLHRQKLYRTFYRPESNPLPLTDQISSRVLCLPIYAGLANDTAEAIAERVVRIGRGAGRPRRKPLPSPAPVPAAY